MQMKIPRSPIRDQSDDRQYNEEHKICRQLSIITQKPKNNHHNQVITTQQQSNGSSTHRIRKQYHGNHVHPQRC